MSETYIRAASRLGWLLQAAEDKLADCEDGAKVGLNFFRRLEGDRLPTDDEALAAAEALVSVGVLRRGKTAFALDYGRLVGRREYCRGVREALSVEDLQPRDTVKLCAALPVGLDAEVEKALRRNTVDMRSNLVEIIASARSWLALASPFWDAETAGELAEVLSRRLEAGVRVDLLGRFEEKEEGMPHLRARLGGYENCQMFAWYERSAADRFRKQTFHFKAVVSDDGAKAYLGTANMNVAGLRSRMELGVILEGEVARQLAQIVKVTLSIARPLTHAGRVAPG